MALEVPGDVSSTPFTRAGLMTLDGDLFGGKKKISTDTLIREIDYVKNHVNERSLQTQSEWQQVRNVCLYWCFSYRTMMDDKAFNAFLEYVGLINFTVPKNPPSHILSVIEANHNQSLTHPTSPALWIKQRPPPQRLPTPSSMSPFSQEHQLAHLTMPSPHNTQDVSDSSTLPHTPRTTDFNTNPRFQGVYNFTDHRQEYEGYQFQCIFRCLKDGKHCRKAPVREMNRHLRDRHHFRQGFKIAGVDWERKRWRGAGADHEDCVGKIVEKDSADDNDGNESQEEYVVR